MTNPVRKAVFPVAGLGTRFLPVTKSVPKEMLPIVDKPIIQYAVEEAVGAGIMEIILVNHSDKQSLESYFTHDQSLAGTLKSKNKQHLLDSLKILLDADVEFQTVFQNEPLGLGHAILCAREQVGNEPFAVILPDDLIVTDEQNCMQQMISIYARFQCGAIAVENVPIKDTGSYGIVETSQIEPGISRISSIVEKPHPEEAPSTLAVVGRYILPPTIFTYLDETYAGSGGEIQLTDAIAMLLVNEQVLAYEFEGTRYDCGTKLGYLMANVAFALKHPDIKKDFTRYIQSLLSE
jgi:UTP--glucose-1-phosphate uridylyltransferase